jgi:hypothetical protein
VYAQSKVLGSHFQIGQARQVDASSSDGFLTTTSFTVGISGTPLMIDYLLFSIYYCGKAASGRRERKK